MKKLVRNTAIALSTLFAFNAQAELINSVEYNGSLYQLHSVTDYYDAVDTATNLGAYLAVITSQEEQNAIINGLGQPLNIVTNNNNRHAFIGLGDEAVEGNFVWDNGDTSTYRNWQINQPNNWIDANGVDQDRAGMYIWTVAGSESLLGLWHDLQPLVGDFAIIELDATAQAALSANASNVSIGELALASMISLLAGFRRKK